MLHPPEDPDEMDEWVDTMILPLWEGLIETGSFIRATAKAISYRLIGSAATYGIAYWITGDTVASGKVAAIEFVVKTAGYIAHERLWRNVK